MEEDVRKELETLKGMVVGWKKSYLAWVSPDGGDEYVARELSQEIESHVYPYVKRLYECKYLSGPEAKEFLDCCYSQVEELRDTLRNAEAQQLLVQKERGDA
jgi:hypothetical protein